MSNKVLVIAEVKNGRLRNVTLEALTVARQVANGREISAAVLGPDGQQYIDELGRYGAQKVYVLHHDALAQYTADAYVQAVLQAIEHTQAEIILMGHTARGKDTAPRLAGRLGAGLVSDCVGVSVEDNAIVFTRPIYAGKAYQKKTFRKGKILATLRPNNFEPAEHLVKPEVVHIEPVIRDIRTAVKNMVSKTAGGVDLSEAKIIVSGGRGVRGKEGFALLQELAEVLGGAVGASRGACDAGYCDYSLQIGQTGKVVTPDLYIACGISGAIQHLAGMSNSKYIVAINKDPDAPIFQAADYGIVGDLFEVVPLLTEEFRKVRMAHQ